VMRLAVTGWVGRPVSLRCLTWLSGDRLVEWSCSLEVAGFHELGSSDVSGMI